MSKKTIVLFEMKGDQFRHDIEAKLRHGPLVYPQLPKRAKKMKAVSGKEEPLDLRVVMEVDDATYQKLAKDALLFDQMRQGCAPAYEKCCEAIASAYEVANAKFSADIIDGDRAAAEALAAQAKTIQVAIDEMGADAEKAWKHLQQVEHKYLVYQVKIGVTLTCATIVLVAGVAILASTPFHFGVGTVFGILGMVKSGAVIVTELSHAFQEPREAIESAEKAFVKVFGGVEKEDKKFKNSWKAQQYTAEVLNTATKVAISLEVLPSLSKLQEKLKRADNKVRGVEKKVHKVAEKVTEYVKRFDTYEKVTKPRLAKMIAENDVSQGYDPLAMSLYMETVATRTEQKLAAQLEKLERVQKDFNDMKAQLDALHDAVEIMLQEPEARDLKKFGKCMEVIGLLGNLAMAGAGCASTFDPKFAEEFATHAGDIATVVITGVTSDLTPEAGDKLMGLVGKAQHQIDVSLAH